MFIRHTKHIFVISLKDNIFNRGRIIQIFSNHKYLSNSQFKSRYLEIPNYLMIRLYIGKTIETTSKIFPGDVTMPSLDVTMAFIWILEEKNLS